MDNKSLVEIVEKTIFLGKDTKLLRAIRRNPWENPLTGTEFLFGLSHFIGHCKRPNSSQKKLLELCVRRIRETSLHISAEKLMEITEHYQKLVFEDHAANEKIHLNLFQTKEGEIKEAVTIVKTIIDARCMLPPYASPEDADKEKETNIHAGLIGIFNLIIWGYPEDYTWINFIKALELGEKDALETFILLLFNIKRSQEMRFTSYDKFQKYRPENLLDGDAKSPVRIPFPDVAAAETIEANLCQIMERVNKACEGFTELVDWFVKHQEEFAFLEKAMWEDIKLRPRYGLRSRGRDKIELDIVPANDYINIEAIQFFPQEFPCADVKVWKTWRGRKESGFLHLYPGFSFSNWDGGNNDISSSKMLYFIALQCYWEIVMGKSSKAEEEGKISTDRIPTATREKLRERLAHVRPFFRKLPEGQHHSDKALGLAQQALGCFIMPDGKTFVREHDRGWQTMETIIPLFTYSAQDIRSWL